jgi:hypothetical protein
MSHIVNFLCENDIKNYSIFHKRIELSMISEGMLTLDLFDRVIESDRTNKKISIFYTFNNVEFDDNLDMCKILKPYIVQTCGFFNIETYKYHKLNFSKCTNNLSSNSVYHYFFSQDPADENVDNGYTQLKTFVINFKKYDKDIKISENSSITYVVQYMHKNAINDPTYIY